jgi:hypothetical protein
MPTLSAIAEWLESTYNDSLTTYTFESENKVRLTNGSAGYYIDITPTDGSLSLEGRRYSESISKTCDGTKEDLIETLQRTI